MLRSRLVSSALFAVVLATPALAHVEQMPHSHTGAVNWPLAAVALAGAAALFVLHRRMAALRS